MNSISKHLNILDYALSLLSRNVLKNSATVSVYSVIIFLLASFQLVTSALKEGADLALKSVPDITVQMMSGGRQVPFELDEQHLFKGVYGSELDGRLSEKGALIAHIIHEEGLDPTATVMVGDRVYDIEGGKENGIVTAAVTYGYGKPGEIDSAGPDVVFETIAALTKTMLSCRIGQ